MTYDELLKQSSNTLQAWLKDKSVKIEHRLPSDSATWCPASLPSWDMQRYNYRIAPPVKYIPFTRATCPLGAEVIYNHQAEEFLLIAKDEDRVYPGGVGWITYQRLFDNYTMADGSPCGTLETP